MGQHNNKTAIATKPISKRLIDLLASVKFAVAIVVITAVACVAGTILPQGAEVERYLARNPDATARLTFFGNMGLTHLFTAWWFLALLCTLSASVTVCSSRRFATILRTKGYSRGRALGSMLTHISFLLILGGAVIRGVWGQKGSLQFHEGQTVSEFVDNRGVRQLPFAIHLSRFEIETYDQPNLAADLLILNWPAQNRQASLPATVGVEQKFADFSINILRYLPDFTVDLATHDATTRSQEPRNPALLVAVTGPNYHNQCWIFANYPNMVIQAKDAQSSGANPLKMLFQSRSTRPREITGPIKSFKSTLAIIDHGQTVLNRTIEVNSPLSYQGYTFYQAGYNPDDLSFTSLQVVKDPGIPVVYAGFGLMVAGLFVVFYLNPWLNQPKETA